MRYFCLESFFSDKVGIVWKSFPDEVGIKFPDKVGLVWKSFRDKVGIKFSDKVGLVWKSFPDKVGIKFPDKVGIFWKSFPGKVHLQLLQYNVAADTWSEVGRMEKERYYHAIAEVNLGAICPEIGTTLHQIG